MEWRNIMGNYGEYYEARQHLNLSQVAYDVVEYDRYAFQEKPSFSKMLNRVFEMYRDDADAAYWLACDRYEDTLKKELTEITESPEKDAVIHALREAYKEKLLKTALSYPRECSFKFQLNRENYAFISEWSKIKNEYDFAGKFIKAVIEEYARKPPVVREEILYRDFIDLVRDCAETQKALIITLKKGDRYEVKPFCVCTDQGLNYHYLAGYSKPTGNTEAQERPASFRLTNIIAYKKTGRSGHLTGAQKKEIDRKIQTVGVQFLLQEPEIIWIKLTQHGHRMYESQAHLRPAFESRYENEDGTWLYKFACTPAQAQFYFFKFGADAEVLSPTELRARFAEQYRNALAVYQLSGEDTNMGAV